MQPRGRCGGPSACAVAMDVLFPPFLVAMELLYMRMRPSIGRMDGPSVGWTVKRNFFRPTRSNACRVYGLDSLPGFGDISAAFSDKHDLKSCNKK